MSVVAIVGIPNGADVGDFLWMSGCVVTVTGSGVEKDMGTDVLISVRAGT